jgi:hypothetical protein
MLLLLIFLSVEDVVAYGAAVREGILFESFGIGVDSNGCLSLLFI